jgi:amidophosphoribosyltransferase
LIINKVAIQFNSKFSMSEVIKHECGIAMVRLLKPLDYYNKKYGTALYGVNQMHVMMQKLRNRGQDGAGIATIKLNTAPGSRYVSRKRSIAQDPIKDAFSQIYDYYKDLPEEKLADTKWIQENLPYSGEVLLGHLRYGTHGRNSEEVCHPVFRQNNWKPRNLLLAGNFNLTNVDELFGHLVELGQHPKEVSDTVTVLERMGHFLDAEVQRLFSWHKSEYKKNHQKITKKIIKDLDVGRILRKATKKFDGGYVMCGLLGHGDAFAMRDPAGIRPAYYYQDDEVVVVASERPAIQTAFNVKYEDVKELPPAHALIVKTSGKVSLEQYRTPLEKKPCSFERIYFSRWNDAEIYHERKRLGQNLAGAVLNAIDYDLKNTVFSFVPNTAEGAFFGLVEGINNQLDDIKLKRLEELGADASLEARRKVMTMRPRVEKMVTKDAKLRTFIADDASRTQLVAGAYDITYGVIKRGVDTLVLMDDSIVRGTTLKENLIKMVARLQPKKIIIVSSAPQIRYPDCYGIDMSKMKDFVAFKALVALLEDNGKSYLLDEAYKRSVDQLSNTEGEIFNEVSALYDIFSQKEISAKIAEIVTPKTIPFDVEIIYQTIEGLHDACPNHKGDWYFTGNYPTKGGHKVINRAFVNYMEGKDVRAYW